MNITSSFEKRALAVCEVRWLKKRYNITPYSDWPLYKYKSTCLPQVQQGPNTIRMVPFTPEQGEGEGISLWEPVKCEMCEATSTEKDGTEIATDFFSREL